MITEEEIAYKSLVKCSDNIKIFIDKLLVAIKKRNIEQHEEFILNAISALTNLLFYDVPHYELLNNEMRINIFTTTKSYILAT